MRFQLFGAVQGWVDERPVGLGVRKQRLVAAALALDVNTVVPVHRLVDLVWPESPPASARAMVHTYISALRRIVEQHGGGSLTRESDGYVLRCPPDCVDVHEFRTLLARARSGDDEARVAAYDAALALWRGEPLAGVADGPVLDRLTLHLREARLTAIEDRAEVLLRLGRHRDVSEDLAPLATEHPTRQRLTGHLMLALHRCGRGAEALRRYERTRAALADELGADPDSALRELHREILAGGVPVDAPQAPRPARPAVAPARQLPAAPAFFVGRDAELAALDRLTPDHTSTGGPPSIVAISGTAGVGKTALAVHWAHRVAHHFPDGQLFVNLRGHSAAGPLGPTEALAPFLRAFGVPAERVPTDADESAALYRSLLAGRRVLVLLDNAASAEQVRPLLPGDPGCAVLVTSRTELAGLAALDGARLLAVGLLAPGASLDLLGRVIGAARILGEERGAAELAALCGHLPLALRIAAANLAARPAETLQRQVTRLREDRLGELAVEGDPTASVSAAFDHSYAALAEPARRLFRLLSLVPGLDFDAPVAASLADADVHEAARGLAALVSAHLLEEPVPERFQMHDLLRQYAGRQVDAAEPAPGVEAARDRLYEHYLRVTLAAASPAGTGDRPPVFSSAVEAQAWLDMERPNLLAAARHAAGHGRVGAAWPLLEAARVHLVTRAPLAEWLATAELALAAAQDAGDRTGAATMHTMIGHALRAYSDFPRAERHLDAGLAIHTEVDDVRGIVAAHNGLGAVSHDQGRIDDAITHYRHALAVAERSGDPRLTATLTTNLGLAHHQRGDLADVERYLLRALELQDGLGDARILASVQASLAELYLDTGRYALALDHADVAIEAAAGGGDLRGEARSRMQRADVLRELERFPESLAECERARDVAARIGMPMLDVFVLSGHAEALWRAGRVADAVARAEEALVVAREHGLTRIEGQVLRRVAAARLAAGDPAGARSAAEAALRAHRRLGQRLDEARALALVGDARAATGDLEGAADVWRTALTTFVRSGSADVERIRARLERLGAGRPSGVQRRGAGRP